jgi:hypothetical protein
MPILQGQDLNGHFFRFGINGKKYYYYDYLSANIAYNKALQQARAIKASQSRHYI